MIDKFMHGFLNRVYDLEDYTQLEINSKLIQKIEEVIENCNNAFEFVDWLKEQGVPEEVQNILFTWKEDGTLKNLLGNLIEELKEEVEETNVKLEETNTKLTEENETIKTQLDTIVNYNITKESDFDVNNVNRVINRLVPNLKSGDTLFVPRGEYYFTETLNFTNLQEGVKIIIDGELIRKGTFSPSLFINGGGFDFTLYKLIGDIVKTGVGVLVGGGNLCFESYINIKRIENFDVGIELNPKSNKGNMGIQYNSLKGKLIVNCNKCIYLNLEDPLDGWVNENAFYDFRLIGVNGVVTNNVNCSDGMGYNNNKFYNIGFEQLSGNGIDLKYCNGTSFLNCRMLEDIGQMYILTNESCHSNLFIFSHIIYENKIDLKGDCDRIIASILDNNGTIISNGFIISGNKSKIHEISNETCAIISDDTTIRKHDTSIFVNSYNQALTITLPQEYNREGFRKVVNVADYQYNITFKDYTGKIVINNKINSIGYWEILFTNGTWNCYKLSYNLGQLPAQYTNADSLEEISTQFKLLLENMRTIGLMKS